MKYDFEYIIEEDKITITKYIGTDTIIEVPSVIENIEVVKIGNYAFEECRNIISVTLPDSIRSIGSHSFYNCRRLRTLIATDCIYTMEDGAFKNCESLKYITLYIFSGKTTCMKNLLSETNEEMHFTLYYSNIGTVNECAKLIFPRYLHDYVENTEARIVTQVTYGAGVHFRECMDEADVDYKRYDDLFCYVTANDTKETACYIAMYRLDNPYKLRIESKKSYFEYLKVNIEFWVKILISNNDISNLEKLAKLELFTQENIDVMIDLSHNLKSIEVTRFFMQYKKNIFGTKEKNFIL